MSGSHGPQDAPTPQDAPRLQDAPTPQDCFEHDWLEIWDFEHVEPVVILCGRCGWKRGTLRASWQPKP